MTVSNKANPPKQEIKEENIKKSQQKGLPGTEFPNGQIPVPKLPFTIDQVRKRIPAECFEKNLSKSLYYMARDWFFVFLCYMLQPYFFQFGILGKFIWWNITGFFGWCLFVVAHDCGHSTFSNYKWINTIVGHICNAPILVPFHGWQNSHRKHHQYHAHVDKDHSWKALTFDEYDEYGWAKYVRFNVLCLLAYPYYLCKESQKGGFTGNHFNPFSVMFKPHERLGAACSALSVISFLGFLFYNWDFVTLLNGYFAPYIVFVCWLDLVTYLQHTDEKSLSYRDDVWEYFLAAFSTVDRDFGSIINNLHHNIETHVIHHIFFTQIPHYNLVKATDAVKDMFGEWYVKDTTPIWKALFKSLKKCHFVPNQGKQVKYESAEGFPVYKAEAEKLKSKQQKVE